MLNIIFMHYDIIIERWYIIWIKDGSSYIYSLPVGKLPQRGPRMITLHLFPQKCTANTALMGFSPTYAGRATQRIPTTWAYCARTSWWWWKSLEEPVTTQPHPQARHPGACQAVVPGQSLSWRGSAVIVSGEAGLAASYSEARKRSKGWLWCRPEPAQNHQLGCVEGPKLLLNVVAVQISMVIILWWPSLMNS